MQFPFLQSVIALALSLTVNATADSGIRGVATRAPKGMIIDGDLSEFQNAFSTPLEYFQPENAGKKDPHSHLRERAAQFFYMWDEEAFYAALRTLDANPANHAPDDRLWEGDAVEWYFDARQDEQFRSQEWPKNANAGAVHCYWTGLKGTNVQPRFCLRPGFLQAIPNKGVEVAARRTEFGMEVEFKLPWVNFPDFKPKVNAIIALDAELCYSDGGPRVFRSFVFGSPLSVQQPANLAKFQLVEKLSASDLEHCGPVMFPIRCDTPWTQKSKPNITGYMALPPTGMENVRNVSFHVIDLKGKKLGEYPGTIEAFDARGKFQRAVAHWPNDLAIPGGHHLLGVVYDKSGKELTRVAPRMVSVNMTPGY